MASDMHSTVPRRDRSRRARRATLATSIGAVGLAAGCGPQVAHVAIDGPNATVAAVIDGDTIDVDIGGRRERVRLLGIDTPEVAHAAMADRPAAAGECFGDAATRFTRSLLLPGAQVRLERDIVGRDHYGRLLAHVHLDEVYVNLEIVRQGYATPLFIEPNGVHRDLIVSAATAAETENLGLWSACG